MWLFLASHWNFFAGVLLIPVLALLFWIAILVEDLVEGWRRGRQAIQRDRAFRKAIAESDAIGRDAQQQIRRL